MGALRVHCRLLDRVLEFWRSEDLEIANHIAEKAWRLETGDWTGEAKIALLLLGEEHFSSSLTKDCSVLGTGNGAPGNHTIARQQDQKKVTTAPKAEQEKQRN